jgi:choline dehydrogenase-like flavoprotein
MNGMAFDRGAASDYDAWDDLGNKGWGWKELLPYFKKAENFHPPPKEIAEKYDITYDPAAHGFDGPIHASYPPFQDELSSMFLDYLLVSSSNIRF